ncbi:MAG: hypothetical protein ACFFG0_56560 [Candidatus Thorarchaeota archaeon]
MKKNEFKLLEKDWVGFLSQKIGLDKKFIKFEFIKNESYFDVYDITTLIGSGKIIQDGPIARLVFFYNQNGAVIGGEMPGSKSKIV